MTLLTAEDGPRASSMPPGRPRPDHGDDEMPFEAEEEAEEEADDS